MANPRHHAARRLLTLAVTQFSDVTSDSGGLLHVSVSGSLSSEMGLQYRDLLMSSHSMIVAQVHVVNGDVILSADGLSCGARDFFASAPFTIHGSSLRSLVIRIVVLQLQKVKSDHSCQCLCVCRWERWTVIRHRARVVFAWTWVR